MQKLLFWLALATLVAAHDRLFVPLPDRIEADADKVALGERLFHDAGLSRDGSVSCATCHPLDRFGVDNLPVSVGIEGRTGRFNAPSVYNAAFQLAQFWDGRSPTLADQALRPLTDPAEMDNTLEAVIAYLKADAAYQAAFKRSYEGAITPASIADALEQFQRTLITPHSPFDRYLQGESGALTPQQEEGFALFRARGCVSCHNGINLGGNLYQRSGALIAMPFTQKPDAWRGREAITGDRADRFFMKVPPLRNVAKTAPYLHDGSVSTLQEVVELMGWHQLGRNLPESEVAKLVAFLESLTGKLPDAYAQ